VVRVNPEKKEEKERVAHALLRATLQLAAAHGFASLGLREVARAAEIAPTSFYRHFGDMEELGLSLVEQLVGPFVASWVEQADAAQGARQACDAITSQALAGAAADPELMRFVLAERVGALPKFRTALTNKLAAVAEAFNSAFAPELGGSEGVAHEPLSAAALALLLEGCAEALERGPEHAAVVRERVMAQLSLLLTGARGARRAP
jgi:AcrR family transcriptional regulator